MSRAPKALPAVNRSGVLVPVTISEALRLVSMLVVHIALARFLGPSPYGVYAYAMSVVSVLVFVVNPDLNVLLARRVARDPATASRYMGLGLTATLVLAVAAILAMVLVAWLGDGRPVVVVATALGGAAVALQSLSLVGQAVFDGLRRSRLEVAGMALGRVVLVVASLAVLWSGGGVVGVFQAQVLGAAVALAVVSWTFRARVGSLGLPAALPDVRALLRDAVPFGAGRAFLAVYAAADVLVLGAFVADDEVGLYRFAAVLVLQLAVVAKLVARGTLPHLAHHLGDPGAAGEQLGFMLRVLLAVSVPALVGGMLVAGDLVFALAGAAFVGSGPLFAVLLLRVPLQFCTVALGWSLAGLGRQPERTRGVAWAAGFNVTANLVAIPLWGAWGACGVAVLTEVVLLVDHARRMRFVPIPSMVEPALRIAVACAVMAGVLWAASTAPVWVRIALGAAVYAAAAMATGAITRRDVQRLRVL